MALEHLGFISLVVIALIETFLSGSFVAPYFRFGIPLFILRFQVRERVLADFEERLEHEFSSGLMPPLVFRRFSATEVAFRERAFAWRLFSYTPIMHGLIRLVPSESTLYVIGWANWFAIAFAGMFFIVADPDWVLVAIAVGVFALIYMTQAFRYRAVGLRLQSEEVLYS